MANQELDARADHQTQADQASREAPHPTPDPARQEFAESAAEQYGQLIERYLFREGCPTEILKDIRQGALLKILTARGPVPTEDRARKAYVMKAARSVLIDWTRASRRRPTESWADGNDYDSSRDGTPEQHAIAEETSSRIEASYAALPARRREVLDRSFGLGQSHDEIGSALGIAPSTSKKHLVLAIAELSQSVNPESEEK